jgi:hypothetical protein
MRLNNLGKRRTQNAYMDDANGNGTVSDFLLTPLCLRYPAHCNTSEAVALYRLRHKCQLPQGTWYTSSYAAFWHPIAADVHIPLQPSFARTSSRPNVTQSTKSQSRIPSLVLSSAMMTHVHPSTLGKQNTLNSSAAHLTGRSQLTWKWRYHSPSPSLTPTSANVS